MDKLVLKKLAFSLLVLFISLESYSQSRFWNKLVPDNAGVQYAGSIGFLSASGGYDLLNEKAELSVHLGYVPENLGGELTIVAVKFHYKPFTFKIKDKFLIQPLNPVFFPSYTLGQNFDFKFEKPQYRKGYYFWSSALRLHLGAGSEIKVLTNPTAKIKSISLYGEVNTNDLYVLSWFQNQSSTPIYQLFKLGYGVKVGF